MTMLDNLRRAIAELPCRVAGERYFSRSGDSCVLGHLATVMGDEPVIAMMREHNREGTHALEFEGDGSTYQRFQAFFGLSSQDLNRLQIKNDAFKGTNHARCLRMKTELETLLQKLERR